MANMREIRSRMKSIQDIMKITNAMYLISSSKLKKARKNLLATEPYFEKLQSTIRHILRHTPGIEHVFFDQREKISEENRKRGYLVITGDKGLAGAYNHNVIKLAEQEIAKKGTSSLFVVGQIGRLHFARKKVVIDLEFLYTAQNPTMYRAKEIAETITKLFITGELDDVYIIYTKMISPMKSEPEMIQILPLQKNGFYKAQQTHTNRYSSTLSPTPEQVMDNLVPNYVKGLIYGVLVESYSSEQNARMVAMEAATSSAKDMIKDLSLLYNRARQASITQEINEIVGGASSMKK